VNKPKWKDTFYVQVVEPDTVFLVSEQHLHLLSGPVYKQLAPLLDGSYTLLEIVGLLASRLPYGHIETALERLEANGYLVEADGRYPAEEAAFWQSLNVQAAPVGKGVTVQAVGQADAEPLIRALATLGVTAGEGAGLPVVVTDDYLAEGLAAINEQALAQKQKWLLLKLVGESIWLGPLFSPEETACWRCLADRVQVNRPVENFVLKKRLDKSRPLQTGRVALASTIELGANMAATEIARWLATGEAAALRDTVVTLNVVTMEMKSHHVQRRPACPACGRPEEFRPDRTPTPIELQPAPKNQNLQPEEALAAYEQYVSPITGIVTHLIDVLPAEGLAYSYIAVHDFSILVEDVKALRRNLMGRSSGKGRSRTQAKLSAIGEAVERYSGVYRGEGEILVRGRYQELKEQAIYPNDVWLFSQKQYENRLEWNRNLKSGYHLVFKPFDPELELDWVPYWSLTEQRFRYFPAASSYYGHPDAFKLSGSCDSNGCAAGPTFADAVLQGFLELVERDCVAMWWYNRVRRPLVDMATFDLPYFEEMAAYYQRMNRTLWVMDITGDLNIPTFVAVSHRTDREVQDILIGLGIHFDPQQAVLRALAEVNQFLTDVFQSRPDGTTHYLTEVEETAEWFRTARLDDHPYLLPAGDQAAKRLSDYRNFATDDTRQDVATCVRLAAELGLETFVLDQSRPDAGLPVARVLVPGLRHFWRRLAPGRLYDTPVKLGWLERPLSEDALNPTSMFF
jgi:bacteriocin biosynthesis cyclodehydratase domain-containing protein